MTEHSAPDAAREIGSELLTHFRFQPFHTPQPEYAWMRVDQNKVLFMQFAKPVGEPDNKLLFMGDGIRGTFCAESQPEQGKTGYAQFQSLSPSASQDAARGSQRVRPGQEGYWLRRVAVGYFDFMGTNFTPGLAPANFLATPPPSCGAR